MNPLIGIVTVLYNGEKVLKDFFESLAIQTYPNFVLYVIDNKSPDNGLALAIELAKMVSFKTVIIKNDDNYGVAKGNNIGIYRALEDGCDLVLLSNNDVTLEINTIETLLIGLQSHHAGLAVPKIYLYGTNLFWTAGGYFNKRSGLNIHRGANIADTGQFDKNEQITFAPTCFMLIDKNVFHRIGFMDEKYFVYWDDTDFIYRATKAQEALWYIPNSLVHHKEGSSTGVLSDFSIRYLYRNLIYFVLKNYPRPYAWYVIGYNVACHSIKLVFKWPFSKWKLGFKSFKEGFILYKNKSVN